MAMYVTDPYTIERVKEERDRTGASARDEVWEGVYVVTPMPNIEHQELALLLGSVFLQVLGAGGGRVQTPANVSDRDAGWLQNFREPDVVVVLPRSKAIDRETHWQGGPDFLVEILSPDDRAREKIPFYGRLGVRELLIVDRDPWGLELWRQAGEELALVERIRPDDARRLKSDVLPLSFHLAAGQPRPRIVATSMAAPQEWTL